MAKTNFQNVDEYLATFPGEVKERLSMIRSIIKEVAPDAEEVISYQIPAYKYLGYLIYFSGYKSHISLSYPFSEALLSTFNTELALYKTSRAAIQFPNSEPLNTTLIRNIVKFRLEENKQKK